jgi:hypothetical protein
MNKLKKVINNKDNIINLVDENIFEKTIKRIKDKNLGSTVIIPHVCNNVGAFGAGFAGDIRRIHPTVAINFELLGKKPQLGTVQYVEVDSDKVYGHKCIYANMIAQNGLINYTHNRRPLNYESLVRSMIDVRNYIKKLAADKTEIHCVKFGSGLAGGDWRFITYLINDIWADYPVFVYSK